MQKSHLGRVKVGVLAPTVACFKIETHISLLLKHGSAFWLASARTHASHVTLWRMVAQSRAATAISLTAALLQMQSRHDGRMRLSQSNCLFLSSLLARRVNTG